MTQSGPPVDTGETPGSGGLGAAVRSGTRLLTASQASLQVVRMLVAIVLARLLVPSDFGLVAMAYIVVNFLDIFKDLGTKAAMVQRRTMSRAFASTVFVVNVVVGVTITALVVVCAPLVALLYGDPAVTPVLQVLGGVIGISSLGLVHQAHLHRQLRFGRLAVLHLAIAITNAVVSLGLAFAGFGVWALVWGTLAGSLAANTLAWLFSDLRLTRSFSWDHVREIRSFSLNLSGSQVFGFTVNNADKFIVGRWLGAGALGHYNIAQRIIMYPVRSVTQVLQEVLFPAMARIQDDNRALGRGYLRALSGISLLTFPAMLGVAVVSGPFVRGVLGPSWEPAIPVIAIIAPVGALQSVLQTVSPLYAVKGRTDWLLRWTMAAGAVTVAAYVVGLPWGVVGVAAAYAVAHVLLFYPAFAIPFRLIELPFPALLRALAPTAGASVAMAGAVLALRIWLESRGVEPLTVLAACIGGGILIYIALMALIRPPAVEELRRLIWQKRWRTSDA